MNFRILGPLEVDDGDDPVSLGGVQLRALLGLLLLHANEVVSSDRIVEALWGDRGLSEGSKALVVAISRLRRAIDADGRVLVTRPPGYQLVVEPGALDLHRAEELVARGRAALAGGDAASASRHLADALALWRGPTLSDLAYEPFAQADIARLEEFRATALEDRIAAELQLGRHAELIAELQGLVDARPLRERPRAQLMLALYRSGRQAEALEVYREGRRVLVEELGIEPGRELQELEGAILRQDAALAPGPGPTAPAAAPRGVFVGRAGELDRLVAGLDDAFAGRGGLFLIEGEPGIGKTGLAEELMARASARGVRSLVGRCWEAGGAPAYWPWVQSLRSYVRGCDPGELRSQLGHGAADLAQILPELRQRFPDLPEPAAPESESARFRLFEATVELLRNASRNQPLLLVLDDLHAADAPSLVLLRFLASELRSMRVLVLGAYRDVDPIPGEPLREALAEVLREPVSHRLELRGLSEPEVGEYVELAATELASPALVATLSEETEGNPLFVGEIVRLLSVEGVPGELAQGAPFAIPQRVGEVIARRLTHLSEECNRVLLLAAVLGREFDLQTVARLSDLEQPQLLEILDEAMTARVVGEVPAAPGRLRFAHVLIRDTLYHGLTAARRVQHHRRVVETLEDLHGDDPGPHLGELAHHSLAGSDFDRCLRYAWRAGDRALRLLAYEEGARLYGTALEALELTDAGDEAARCRLLLSLGEAEARAGDTPAARRASLEAADIARRLGLPRELARAAAGYGGRFSWIRAGSDARIVPLLEEGLAALPGDDVELRVRILSRLAGALRDEPNRDRRDRLSAEAVELARRSGDAASIADALIGRAGAVVGPDTLEEVRALGTEAKEIAEAAGDRERACDGLFIRLLAEVQAGDMTGAERDLVAVARIAGELRQPTQLWEVRSARAMIELAAGRLEDGERLSEEALGLGERAQPAEAIPVHRVQRYTLRDFRGGLEEVEAEIEDLVVRYPARTVFRCVLAHLWARTGRAAAAAQALEELGRDEFAAVPFDQEWLFAVSLLAETAALVDAHGSAEVLYRLLSPYAACNACDYAEGTRGSMARYLGRLAVLLGRADDAARHFDVALELNARMGARPWLAHTRHDYAQFLAARGEAGDAERARELAAEAVAGYRELGMDGWAAAVSV